MARNPDRLTRAAEDFLKAVLVLDQAGIRATTTEVAERLDVSAPTVSLMAKRLAAQGLVQRTPYRGVALTDQGERLALEVLRHHRLVERYLVEALGMALDEVHAEAERLEHVLSDTLEAKIDAVLGYPTHDPHGDPIPDSDLNLPAAERRPLASLDAGQRSTVTRVPDRDVELLRYLTGIGLVPGSAVDVIVHGPFGGPITVRTSEGQHALDRELASTITVA